MSQWIGSALIQILTWRRTGANAWLLSIGPLATNFNELLLKKTRTLVTKVHLKLSSAKWRPSFPGGICLWHTHQDPLTNTNVRIIHTSYRHNFRIVSSMNHMRQCYLCWCERYFGSQVTTYKSHTIFFPRMSIFYRKLWYLQRTVSMVTLNKAHHGRDIIHSNVKYWNIDV